MRPSDRKQRSAWRPACRIGAALALLCLLAGSARGAQDAQALIKKYIESAPADREREEKKLRNLGMEAVPPLREFKTGDEKALELLQGLIVEILMESSRADPEDAQIVHAVAREAGKAKRYATAERLYGRARKLYEELRKDAADRKDKIKDQEYKELRDVCEKMHDKAGRKDRGDDGKGVNLGVIRIGTKHDMTDDWD
jgi:hypothetical protein